MRSSTDGRTDACRFSDNVTKTFALTVSVLICALIQVLQYNLRPGALFLAGATTVIAATWGYVHGQN